MFLVCGEALYDVFTPPQPLGATVAMQAVAGGSPFNVAIGLARLGAKVALLAGISNDALGEGLVRHVAHEGVATTFLRRKALPTTLSLVGLGTDGVPSYTFYGHAAADVSLTEADLPVLADQVTGLHFGSYTLVARPIADTLAGLAARYAHRLISLDPNIRPTVEPDMAVWRQRIGAMLTHAGVVKASCEDLALIHPGESPAAIAARWRDTGPALVVMTDGAEGATAYWAGGEIAVPSPHITVVDTVGAGDSFQAALIAGLVRRNVRSRADVAGLDAGAIGALLEGATRAAAITCSRRGADLPRAGEL